jgi:hypothetical protein
MAEFMSFEEVLKELQIDDGELKKLISRGELRGFREGKSMKFKKEDVANLKKGREAEPTIILTDSDQEMGIAESSDELILDESTSDTVLNIGEIMSPEKQEEEIVFSDSTEEFSISPHDSDPEAAIPTVEVPSVGEDLGISGETESDAQLVASKSAPELSPGITTEAKAVRAFKPPSSEDLELAGAAPEAPADMEEEAVSVAPRKTQSGRISRSARLRAMQMKQSPAATLWSMLAVVAIVFLVLPAAIVLNRMQQTTPEWVTSLAQTFRSIVGALLEGMMG